MACENLHNALPRKRRARGCKHRDECLALCLRHVGASRLKVCPIGMSRHRLARVDVHGEWRILVMTNMADDETGEPGV